MTADLKRYPLVSLVIPCLDEEFTIAGCLRSVLGQTYPRNRMEVLVVDGGSRDHTVPLVREIGALFPQVRLRLLRGVLRQGAARCNRGISASEGEVVVRMNAHACYHPEYVLRCVQALERTGADKVGGTARVAHRTFFQEGLATAMDSPLAAGRSMDRDLRAGFVDAVRNGAFRRRVFETAGLFDADATADEEAELNFRITRAGGRIYRSPDLIAYYFPRRSPWALALQYYEYGLGRARTTIKHRGLPSRRFLGPFCLVAAMAALLAACAFSGPSAHLLGYATGLYLTGVALESLRLGRARRMLLAPVIFLVLPIIHVSHGIGFAIGLVRYALRPDWSREPERLGSVATTT